MLKSPMPPVYVPRHQVVKAKSFPAKRRVHSSWIGQRTCVHQRQALGNPGCHEPTMIGDALCNTHVCSFLEVRYTWVYHIIITLLLLWIMHWLGFIIPNSWSWNHLQLFGWSTHYSLTTHSLLIHHQQLNKKRPGASGASMAPQVLISNSCGVKSCQYDCGTVATALMALGCKGRAPSIDKDHQNLEMPLLGCETVERQH